MRWFVQLVGALRYCHSQRILHRDLKTANIFLTHHDIVKVGQGFHTIRPLFLLEYFFQLGDFGIATELENSFDVKTTIVGSPYYLSPEVCSDIPYNAKSDVWVGGGKGSGVTLARKIDSFSC